MHPSDTVEKFIVQMPKVELHVHLEGSVQPQTLLKLANRHNVALPANNLESLHDWHTFRDFNHFLDIYMAISGCLRTGEDIELIAREFLIGQAEQNIIYSEATFTHYNQYITNVNIDNIMPSACQGRFRKWSYVKSKSTCLVF